MAREQSPISKQAFQIWVDSGRQMKPGEIATKLDVKPELIRKWKNYYKWDEQPDPEPKKRGAPRGNRNAKGNKGGAPLENGNAVTHGFFRKFLPDDPETLEIFNATEEMSPLEILWLKIRVATTNILRAQKIQHVKDKDDVIKVLKKKKPGMFGDEQEWEYQHASDRQAVSLTSQATAMGNLTRMIKQYEDMLRAIPPDQVQEEQRLRIDKLKAEVKKIEGDDGEDKELNIVVDYGDGDNGDSQGTV